MPSSVAFFADGASHPFTTPLDLLRFSPLSPLGPDPDGPRGGRSSAATREVGPFEGLTAHDWIVSAMGPQAWDRVWGPLLRGKFGDRAEDISMAWLWSKLTLRRQIKGAEARGEVLGYPRGTFEPLFRAARRADRGPRRPGADRPARRPRRRAATAASR